MLCCIGLGGGAMKLYHVITRREYQIADKHAEADTGTSLSNYAENGLPREGKK